MKTIYLEVDDSAYQTILNFIELLPKNRCRILEDDDLTQDEQNPIKQALKSIEQGDYSEFDDWEAVKHRL